MSMMPPVAKQLICKYNDVRRIDLPDRAICELVPGIDLEGQCFRGVAVARTELNAIMLTEIIFDACV